MRLSLSEIASCAGSIEDLDGFWAFLHGQLQLRGADSALLGVLASPRELEHMRLSNALIWKSSYSQAFFDAFDSETLLENDHTAEHCLVQNEVLFWHDPRHWEDASPVAMKRAEIERDLGLDVGFTVPSSYFNPSQVGGIGVAMADVPLREFDRFWRQEGREVVAICGLLDAGMRGQHLSELVSLSPRERECLTWLAVGMRPGRIADRLGVSEKSIEKYVFNARRKLRAATRDHAVAKALMLGLIDP